MTLVQIWVFRINKSSKLQEKVLVCNSNPLLYQMCQDLRNSRRGFSAVVLICVYTTHTKTTAEKRERGIKKKKHPKEE